MPCFRSEAARRLPMNPVAPAIRALDAILQGYPALPGNLRRDPQPEALHEDARPHRSTCAAVGMGHGCQRQYRFLHRGGNEPEAGPDEGAAHFDGLRPAREGMPLWPSLLRSRNGPELQRGVVGLSRTAPKSWTAPSNWTRTGGTGSRTASLTSSVRAASANPMPAPTSP